MEFSTKELNQAELVKINIPAGYKAVIKDGVITFEKEQEESKEFEDGDILHSKTIDKIVIFKAYTDEFKRAFCSHYNNLREYNYNWSTLAFRHATEEEKQAFFNSLKEKGLHWNAETKVIEKIRERAGENGLYLYIDRGGVIIEAYDEYNPFDDKNYNSGNYYRINEIEQAEKDSQTIKAIFERRLRNE